MISTQTSVHTYARTYTHYHTNALPHTHKDIDRQMHSFPDMHPYTCHLSHHKYSLKKEFLTLNFPLAHTASFLSSFDFIFSSLNFDIFHLIFSANFYFYSLHSLLSSPL